MLQNILAFKTVSFTSRRIVESRDLAIKDHLLFGQKIKTNNINLTVSVQFCAYTQ